MAHQERESDSLPASTLDLCATMAPAAGPDARTENGGNLLPYLRGEIEESPQEVLFWRSLPNAAVRSGKWKLWRVDLTDQDSVSVLSRGAHLLSEEDYAPVSAHGQITVLHDLEADIGERENVAGQHRESSSASKRPSQPGKRNWRSRCGPPTLNAGRSARSGDPALLLRRSNCSAACGSLHRRVGTTSCGVGDRIRRSSRRVRWKRRRSTDWITVASMMCVPWLLGLALRPTFQHPLGPGDTFQDP